MNQRNLFIVCAITAGLLLCCACYVIVILSVSKIIDASDGVSVSNLMVDIVVGLFTVWGLFWAATEFAQSVVKPVLRLLPGRQEKAEKPSYSSFKAKEFPLMREPPFLLPGWYGWAGTQGPERDPHIECGLYLKNETSRAGRHVRLVMHVLANPAPSWCKFWVVFDFPGPPKKELRSTVDPVTSHHMLPIQFGEELVVYQSPVRIGSITMHWDPKLSNNSLPKDVAIDYHTYTLDSAKPFRNRIDLHVEWELGEE